MRTRARTGGPARRAALIAGALACLGAAALVGARALWLDAKATLAQHLLARAWHATLVGKAPSRPWPWADVRAVARLDVPDHAVALVALGDASGEALAFGPGLVAGNPVEAAGAALVFGGHRDTHMAFLERVAPGTELRVQGADGRTHAYRSEPGRVVDVRRETLAIDPDAPGLVLVTCWPFDAARAGGPLRWVVTARPVGAAPPPVAPGSDAPVTASQAVRAPVPRGASVPGRS